MMSIVSLLLSVFLINLIRFPFKAPDETMRRVSLDRFFLVHGTPLFLNLLLITASLGLIVSTQLTSQFFLMMMGGFMLAILSEKYVFANAELKSESVAGCLFIGAAILLLWLRHSHSALIMASVLCGFGIGIIGSRFLLSSSSCPPFASGAPRRAPSSWAGERTCHGAGRRMAPGRQEPCLAPGAGARGCGAGAI
jgi:hypothetical protein